MRKIKASEITEMVKRLFLKASYYIGDDIMAALKSAYEKESSEIGKSVLGMILKNNKIAAKEEIAICQDTGLAILFIKLGQEVNIVDGSFSEAINEGVERAYVDGYLRKSSVTDPVIDRKNSNTNTPAIIYTDIVPGDKIHFLVTPKGFGSENMSALAMLKPADGVKGTIDFIVETVRKAGPNPCPPTIVGVGMGGTSELAMMIAKKATLRRIGEHNSDTRYADMEIESLRRINALGIGPGGLGGNTTSLAVNINYAPTHIAGMPIAVNICCHAARHAEGVL